ncbi:MAG: hypothetical protein ACLUHE_01920 [Christensenellales bacterium]
MRGFQPADGGDGGRALLFTVLSLAARKPLLSLLFGQIDADVMDAALTYLTVSAIELPVSRVIQLPARRCSAR